MKIKKMVMNLVAASCVLGVQLATAADHVIEMLDQADGETMVFKPTYLTVAPGDTVTFRPTHKTHYVKAMTAPAGVTKFSSKEDEEFTVTLDQPGMYFYVCPPHLMMGMVGAIQVGEGPAVQDQIPNAVKTVKNLRGRMMSNGDRADKLIQTMEKVK